MATLYEILGLSKNATPQQIEQGYVLQSEMVQKEGLTPEQARLRQTAIKEAFAVLSSPSRRQNYDDRMNRASQVSYEVVEKRPLPWPAILITCAVLGSGIFYYQHKAANEARLEELAHKAALAQAEADAAAKALEVENARAEQQKMADQRMEEAQHRRDMDESRREGDRIRSQLEQQAVRDTHGQDAARQRAKYEQEREEQLARVRNEQREQALKRALALQVRVPD